MAWLGRYYPLKPRGEAQKMTWFDHFVAIADWCVNKWEYARGLKKHLAHVGGNLADHVLTELTLRGGTKVPKYVVVLNCCYVKCFES
jgi:hypothetical protein